MVPDTPQKVHRKMNGNQYTALVEQDSEIFEEEEQKV